MPVARKASSFPPQYLKLLLKVADTGETLIIDNLGDQKGKYNTLAQEVNKFRARYREEAETAIEKEISAKIDGVTLRVRNQEPPYHIIVEPTGEEFASALDSLLAEDEKPFAGETISATTRPSEQDPPSEAENVLGQLYGKKESKDV